MQLKYKRRLPPQGAYKTAIRPPELVAKLGQNENAFGTTPKVVEALRNFDASLVFRYPDPQAVALREKIAKYVGLGVSPSNVACFSGVDEAIRVVSSFFLDERSTMVCVKPTFAIYPLAATFYGTKISAIPLERDFSFSNNTCEAIVEAIPTADLVCLCNPDNPTGTTIKRQYLERIISAAEEKSIPVIVDEAYFEFFGETIMDLVLRKPNLIVFRSMSKSFGLAGLRLGFLVSSEELAGEARRWKPIFNVNNFAQVLGAAALDDLDFVKITSAKIIESREALSKAVSALGIKVYPSKGNFILAHLSDNVFDGLLENGVETRDFVFEGYDGKFVRITAGSPQENEYVVKTLAKLLGRS